MWKQPADTIVQAVDFSERGAGPRLAAFLRLLTVRHTVAMAEEGDDSIKRSQAEPDASQPSSSAAPGGSTTRSAATSNAGGDSRRSSLNKSGARTPRFDLLPMTEYFESSPATPNDEGSDNEERLGWGAMSDGSQDSPPASRTPTFNQSYNNLRRNLSMKSLRELEIKDFQRAAWRKKNDPRKRPRDLEQLLVYAATGGARGSSNRLRMKRTQPERLKPV